MFQEREHAVDQRMYKFLDKAIPSASAGIERLADWMERVALLAESRSLSLEEARGSLRSGGYVEGLERADNIEAMPDRGGEELEAVTDAAMRVIDDRSRYCGHTGYPFVVSNDQVSLKPDGERSPYAYLLALSEKWPGPATAEDSPSKDFEEISAAAARSYFNTDKSIVFGFPRRYDKKGFLDALGHLCSSLGEAIKPNHAAEGASDQNDANLDVVVWKDMADGRAGKLVGFGQCATGHDLRIGKKDTDLQIDKFVRSWVAGHFVLDPIKLLFTPDQLDAKLYHKICFTNLVFDRCRLSEHLGALPPSELATYTARLERTLARSALRKVSKKAQPTMKAGRRKRRR